ncbi:hypothetical protein DsansV1_C09g0091361 [Dioscorea sansibarensis]
MNPQSGNQLNETATANYRDESHNVGNEVLNPIILAPTISQGNIFTGSNAYTTCVIFFNSYEKA